MSTPDEDTQVTYDDVTAARERIRPTLTQTPLWRSRHVDDVTGREVYFKCENLQETGSFKVRGALNAVKVLQEKVGNLKGVAARSTGSFGIAIAFAAKQCGVPCTVVIDPSAYAIKGRLAEAQGAKVVLAEAAVVYEELQRVATASGYHIVHSVHDDVIAGQGTVGLEILETEPDVDAILIAVGGGSLASGVTTVVNKLKPSVPVYCVEPAGKDLVTSLQAGRPMWGPVVRLVDTIADGLATVPVRNESFRIFSRFVQPEVLTVNDEDIVSAMQIIFDKLKLVAEPSGAVSLAAIISGKLDEVDPERKLRKVAVVITGGNTNVNKLPWT